VAAPSDTGRPTLGACGPTSALPGPQHNDRYSRAVSDAGALTREDLLLLLTHGADGPYPVDPVRLMKGAFLAVERGQPEWKGLFDFRAYDYGPFDRAVYDARDALVRRGYLEVTIGRYGRYELTTSGASRAADLRAEHGANADWIRRIGRYVSTRSFSQLLEEIYTAYPRFRARSLFRS
jgi:uncharacterized protein